MRWKSNLPLQINNKFYQITLTTESFVEVEQQNIKFLALYRSISCVINKVSGFFYSDCLYEATFTSAEYPLFDLWLANSARWLIINSDWPHLPVTLRWCHTPLASWPSVKWLLCFYLCDLVFCWAINQLENPGQRRLLSRCHLSLDWWTQRAIKLLT